MKGLDKCSTLIYDAAIEAMETKLEHLELETVQTIAHAVKIAFLDACKKEGVRKQQCTEVKYIDPHKMGFLPAAQPIELHRLLRIRFSRV
jgi:hypothetical protein